MQNHRGPPKLQQFLFPVWRDYSAGDLPSNASTRGTRNDQNVIKLSRVTWKNKQQEVYLQKIYVYMCIYIRIYLYTYTFETTIGPNWGPINSIENGFVHVCSYEKIGCWKADRWTWRTRDPGTCQQCVCMKHVWQAKDIPKNCVLCVCIYIYISYHIRYIHIISFSVLLWCKLRS